MNVEQAKERERALIDEVSSQNLTEYNENVAKWVRITSTQDEIESLKYIQSELESFGFETQMPFYDGYISYPIHAFVTIEGTDAKAYKGISSCFTPSTAIGGLVAEACDWSEPTFSGKIVLIDGLADYPKIDSATKKGAVGVLFLHDENIHNGPASDIWGSPTVADAEDLPKIPVVCITAAAGADIRERMAKGKTVLRMESEVYNRWSKCPILIADLPSPKSDKFVLFSGHIDSWDYGAMDNGSANATMMEVGRVLAAHRDELLRGVRITFWSGHSQGKYAGSSWYVDHHFEEVQDNCVAYVNIDSPGGIGATVVEEPPVMAQAYALAKDVFECQLPGVQFNGKRMARNADQSFFGTGVTSMFGTFSEQDNGTIGDSLSFRFGNNSRAGGLGWWWHTDQDTMDKLDPAFVLRDAKLYLAVIWRLLTTPLMPFSIYDGLMEVKETMVALQEKLEGKFDMGTMLSRVESCLEKAKAFDAECGSILVQDEKSEAALARQMKVLNNLVRILYRENDEFHFDRCGALYPIPSLRTGEDLARSMEGSSRFYMYRVELQKGYNRVMYLLRNMLELM